MYESIGECFQAQPVTAYQPICAGGERLPYATAEYGCLHRHRTKGHDEEMGAQVWLREYGADGSKGDKTLIANIEVGPLRLTIKPTRLYQSDDPAFDTGYNFGT